MLYLGWEAGVEGEKEFHFNQIRKKKCELTL